MTAWLPAHTHADTRFIPGPEQKLENMSLEKCINTSTSVYNSYHNSFPNGKVELCCIKSINSEEPISQSK